MLLRIRTSLFGLIGLASIFQSWADLSAQESSTQSSLYSQSQQGVTVQLEKVSIDRIFNSTAFLNAEKRRSPSDLVNSLRDHLPARAVTFFISVVGETKSIGVSKIDFVDGKKTLTAVHRFFSPPKWQSRLPNLAIDSKANGIETRHLLDGKTQLSDIYPAKLEVKVTTANSTVLIFKFENLEF